MIRPARENTTLEPTRIRLFTGTEQHENNQKAGPLTTEIVYRGSAEHPVRRMSKKHSSRLNDLDGSAKLDCSISSEQKPT